MTASRIFDTDLVTEAVADATGLGRRAAEWTALVALHAGIFTRLQLRAWLGSSSPDAARSEASRIIGSLRSHDLVTEEELAGIGQYVHIRAKKIYRAMGEADNRNRRRPKREKAIERLLCLDYVLDHPDEAWLPTEGGRRQACEEAGIDSDTWPRKVYPAKDGESETTRYFVEKFPLAVDPESRSAVVACVSPGSTTARLGTWLEAYSPLFEALGRADFALTMVHVSSQPELEEPALKDLQSAARKLGSGTADEARLERIRQAIRVGTKESLEPVGGLSQALETSRKIQARREKEGSAKPMRVTAQAWTSTRIAGSESDA